MAFLTSAFLCCFFHITLGENVTYNHEEQGKNPFKFSLARVPRGMTSLRIEEKYPTADNFINSRKSPDKETPIYKIINSDPKSSKSGNAGLEASTMGSSLHFITSSQIAGVFKDKEGRGFKVPVVPTSKRNKKQNGLSYGLLEKNTEPLIVETVNRGHYKTEYQCGPKKACVCHPHTRGRLKACCSNVSLREFPTDLPPNVTTIDASNNTIFRLALSSLWKYQHLRNVNLNGNIIREIISSNPSEHPTIINPSEHPTIINPSEHPTIKRLELSNNRLGDISGVSFGVLATLEYMFLQYNYISRVANRSFHGLHSLIELDLAHNRIKFIELGAFDSLSRLKILFLNDNPHLGYDDKRFAPRLFKNLENLQHLWIQGNSNKGANESYPNQVFAKLPKLSALKIDGLGGGAKPAPELANLSALKTLMLGLDGHCSIQNISSTFFQNVKHLKSLVLWGCNITGIDPTSFQNLGQLWNYSVGYPHVGYEFDTAFQDLEGFKNSPLRTVAFTGFKQTKCNSLSYEHASYLKYFNLTGLFLNYNFISTIDKDFLHNLPLTLEKLRLRGNKFTIVQQAWNYMTYLLKLKEVDVRDQNIKVPPVSRDSIVMKGRISPCSECAQNYYRSVGRDDEMYHSTIEQSYTGHFSEKKLCDASKEVCVPPNLTDVLASGFTEFGRVLLFHNLSSNSLSCLDFSYGFLSDWGNGKLPETVKTLDISNNFCDTLKPSFFPQNNSLEHLCIHNNYLGPVFAKDVNGSLFSHLGFLKGLHIGMNYIDFMPKNLFRGLKKLEYINMAENKICSLDIDFSAMPALKYIDVSKNVLTQISMKSRQDLDELAEKHHIRIDLRDNPLPCDCDGIDLLRWMLSSKVEIAKGRRLTCKGNEPIGDLPKRLDKLERTCNTYLHLILASSFVFSVFLLIIACGLLYKYRWKLIYAKNVWLIKMYGFRPNGVVPSQCLYDAYVVYSEEDRSFALCNMIQELESKRGHKLCLQDRDFLPGTRMSNNITCAIQNSTFTLLLVSPDFLQTKELEYAMQMALMEEYYNDQNPRDVRFIVRYQYTKIEDVAMTTDLLMLMKSGRFLDYPDDGDSSLEIEAKFWDRLSREIGHTQNPERPDMLNTV